MRKMLVAGQDCNLVVSVSQSVNVTYTNVSENLFGESHEELGQPVAADGKKKFH